MAPPVSACQVPWSTPPTLPPRSGRSCACRSASSTASPRPQRAYARPVRKLLLCEICLSMDTVHKVFVQLIHQWLTGIKPKPIKFIEPFVGGGIVGLHVAFRQLADHVILAELDEDVASV